jgi:hypothetical protein
LELHWNLVVGLWDFRNLRWCVKRLLRLNSLAETDIYSKDRIWEIESGKMRDTGKSVGKK